MSSIPAFVLKPGKEKQARSFHPWIFSGAIARAPSPESGAGIVRVESSDGGFVAWAQHNPTSSIRLRLLSWEEARFPDEAWHAQRLERAMRARERFQGPETTVCRLVFAESDGLPGLIVDRLGDRLVVQFLTATMDGMREAIVRLLADLAPRIVPAPFSLAAILERSDGDGRRMEGLPIRNGVLWGAADGATATVREQGLSFLVDTAAQKTGFYADQRENRLRTAFWAQGARVLDVCCYSGGFSSYAARSGATSITLLDSSAEALELARANIASALASRPAAAGPCAVESIEGDAFRKLRELKEAGRRFDLIILDPPKLAPTRASLPKAGNAYKDLNLQALHLLEAGGKLATFSCSGLVSAEEFQMYVAWAAKDARARVQILERFAQAPCHPVPLSFPEASYLKGLLLRLEDRVDGR